MTDKGRQFVNTVLRLLITIKMLKKFINFITFIDQPIKKKFILFSLGVLFWFVVMFVISIATYIDINNKTGSIVNKFIPQDRTAQKITGKLQELSIDATEIINISDIKDLEQKINLSMARISDIRAFISAITNGGQVHDINRDNNETIESFPVIPLKEYREAGKYSDALSPLIDSMEEKLKQIADLKLNILSNRIQDSSQLVSKISGFKQLLHEASSLSQDYSVKIAKLYTSNSQKVGDVTKLAFYILAGVLLMATTLLIVFTISISKAIIKPVKSITSQIRSLWEGEVDLTQRIDISSKDEMGILSKDFNILMEEIHDLSTFKKIIEEDNNLEDVYFRLGKSFSEKIGLNEFIIYEVSTMQNKMKPVYPIILNEKDILCSEEILHNSDLCKVKKTGRIISSIEYPDICKQFKHVPGKVHVCVPIIIGGKAEGVVQFLFDKKNNNINRKDKRMFKAEQYIKEALSVIEAKRLMNTLQESALKDSLTGLYNRRFLQEYTETLIAGVIRRQKNVGLMMCDLDFFKQVNDLYGHNVGDSVLKETCEIIKKCVRTSDLVIRFGGEEFLVLMLDINGGETSKIADKIRETIEKTKIKVSDGIIKKTISIGISEFPIDTESFWQAIKFADVALYKAKDTGRNKVVRFTVDMWTEKQF
ncbi:MAG: sensor domain-containing diguanylate cyclase [Nitrospirae bacterium]|nr:sensor domain-containing diguanylate cyclase [Nitrospirota bacterium]